MRACDGMRHACSEAEPGLVHDAKPLLQQGDRLVLGALPADHLHAADRATPSACCAPDDLAGRREGRMVSPPSILCVTQRPWVRQLLTPLCTTRRQVLVHGPPGPHLGEVKERIRCVCMPWAQCRLLHLRGHMTQTAYHQDCKNSCWLDE